MAWWRFDFRASDEPVAATPPDGGEESCQMERILRECSTFRTPATIFARDAAERCEARFAGLSGDLVRFDLPADAELPSLGLLAVCCVTFVHAGRTRTFLAPVRRLDTQATTERPRQLALRVPGQIAAEDLRSATRVSCSASGIAVTLDGREGLEGRWLARPLNLSATGALLDLCGDDDAQELAPGSEVRVTLRRDQTTVLLRGVVRRREPRRVALFFPSSLATGNGAEAGLPSLLDQLALPGSERSGAPGAPRVPQAAPH